MRLKFKSHPQGLKNYNDHVTGSWYNGDEKEVPDSWAHGVLKDFKHNFTVVQPPKTKEELVEEIIDKAAKEEHAVEDAPNKMVTEEKPYTKYKSRGRKK